MHHAAVTDGGENAGEREFVAEDGRLEIAIGIGDRAARTKEDVLVSATVLGKSEFGIGAAIEVIEDSFGAATLCDATEILNVDDAWRSDGR
jgi:hypothetical protein